MSTPIASPISRFFRGGAHDAAKRVRGEEEAHADAMAAPHAMRRGCR